MTTGILVSLANNRLNLDTFLCTAKFSGVYSLEGAEVAGKTAAVTEAALFGDGSPGEFVVGQQPTRFLHLPLFDGFARLAFRLIPTQMTCGIVLHLGG